MTRREEIAEEIDGICALAASPKTPAEDSARLYDGALDFFYRLNESQVMPHLRTILEETHGIKGPRRAVILEKALALAGHYGNMELVARYVETLRDVLAVLSPAEAAEGTTKLEGVLRMLRRLGFTEEASSLLSALEASAEGTDSSLLRHQLQVATARITLGEVEQAKRWHERAFAELKRLRDARDRGVSERLRLCRALARSLAALPEPERVEGLQRLETQQIETITDRFNTNSHFSLALVAFFEYLLFAYVGEGPGISARMRQMLDEEEYLIRRRIHRDTREISR